MGSREFFFCYGILDSGDLLICPVHPHGAVKVGLPPVPPNSQQPETSVINCGQNMATERAPNLIK